MTTQIKGSATSTFGGNVDVTGNVVTDAPCLIAQLTSSVSISNNTYTVIPFDSVVIDTTNDYDNTTNYRYTPSVAGYYQVNVACEISGTSISRFLFEVAKNGTSVLRGFYGDAAYNGSNASGNCSGLIYCNGTTDYITGIGFITGTSPAFNGSGSRKPYMDIHLVRAV